MIEKERGKRGGERRKIQKKENKEIVASKSDKWRKQAEKGKKEKKKREYKKVIDRRGEKSLLVQ